VCIVVVVAAAAAAATAAAAVNDNNDGMMMTCTLSACRTVYTIIGQHGVDDGFHSAYNALGEAANYFNIGVSYSHDCWCCFVPEDVSVLGSNSATASAHSQPSVFACAWSFRRSDHSPRATPTAPLLVCSFYGDARCQQLNTIVAVHYSAGAK
jgi:hypothetical protein